jgi:lipid II:glycine glycyltransferase (peptidoglycan interpeptide bridge formation enzyme)
VGQVATDGRPRGSGSLEVRASRTVEDPVWDRFVDRTAGGHYTQSVAWARFRASFGWDTSRLTVWEQGELIAGAQVLVRRFRGLGAIGYAQHGPIVGSADDETVDLTLRALLRLCRREQVRYLLLRPPAGGRVGAHLLNELGFVRTYRLKKPAVTARVELTGHPDEILARMRKSTRANVRRGLSRGLVARRGGADDLDTLLHLERMLATRKGFPSASASRYRTLWRSLEADDRGLLFLVEDEDGSAISAQLAVRVGDTLYSHMMAWSGEQANRKPNELLDWTAMMWARGAGCRYYDFEGIGAPPVAEGVAAGPDSVTRDRMYVPEYKLGFGADVVPASLDYELVVNPVLRLGHTRVLPKLAQRPLFRRLDTRLQRALAGRAGGETGA